MSSMSELDAEIRGLNAPIATFDRFDICEAHALLEADYNVSGMLQERPSNQRRNESTSCQLARIGYRPSPMGGTYEHLTENGRAIYHELIRRYSLMLPMEHAR